MAKEEKRKNIVRDVIPPKRSIRNIELPRNKILREEKRVDDGVSVNVPIRKETPPLPVKTNPKPESATSPYTYVYEKKKGSNKAKYVAISVLVIAVAFGVSAFFKSADIRITPNEDSKQLSTTFKATKNSTDNSLSFQVVTVSKSEEKSVSATGEEQVQKKAQGKIVIYNNYSATSQKLVATTRFETPEGLIFRLVSPATIPGRQVIGGKTVAGSVEALVQADKAGAQYNIGLKDFTIPGFKGDAKYTSVYGRSKTTMSGGFSGTQKIVSKDIVTQSDAELQGVLKDSLAKDIASQIPPNFVLFSESITYNYEPITQVEGASSAQLSKKGTASGIIFDKSALSKIVASKVMSDVKENVMISNFEALNFSIATGTAFDPNNDTLLTFALKGQPNFVWVFDENKLKSDLLGLTKNTAKTVIGTYPSIKEAVIETKPFWNQTIPSDPKKVTITNTHPVN